MKSPASRALKWLHRVALAGFGASMAAAIVLERFWPARAVAASTDPLTPALAVRIAGIGLLATIASGMLLLAQRPGHLEQRWLWAKLLLTMVIAPAVWWHATPTMLAWAAVLTLLAALIAVWRPRLGSAPPAD